MYLSFQLSQMDKKKVIYVFELELIRNLFVSVLI